jgi:hypothetical protein
MSVIDLITPVIDLNYYFDLLFGYALIIVSIIGIFLSFLIKDNVLKIIGIILALIVMSFGLALSTDINVLEIILGLSNQVLMGIGAVTLLILGVVLFGGRK